MREFRDDTVIYLYLPYPHFKQFTYNEVNLECIWNLFQHKKANEIEWKTQSFHVRNPLIENWNNKTVRWFLSFFEISNLKT